MSMAGLTREGWPLGFWACRLPPAVLQGQARPEELCVYVHACLCACVYVRSCVSECVRAYVPGLGRASICPDQCVYDTSNARI